MKLKFLLFVSFSIAMFASMAQNKTLGVGTATPNANAALHVESPTNNQGFIMPRLTESQRTATSFISALSGSDVGLMVYDTDLKGIYIWDGSKWGSAAKLAYPYKDSVILPTGTNDLIAIKYNNPELKRLLRIEHLNTANTASALSIEQRGQGVGGFISINNPTNGNTGLSVTTNSNKGGALAPVAIYGESTGTGSLGAAFWNTNPANTFPALYTRTVGTGNSVNFEILNPANSSAAVRGSTDGTGSAGRFIVNNAASTAYALVGESNGAALGAGVFGNNTGTGFGVHGKSSGTAFGSSAVYGEHTGTGDAAGAFRISNSGNNFAALYGETNGAGGASSAVRGLNLGGGNGAYFRKNGATPNSAAMWADNFGNEGYGAIIQNVSATNPKAALFAEAVGTGASIWGNKDATETGNVIDATHGGTAGYAGNFAITNASNASPALNVTTNGAGVAGNFINNGTTFAIYAQAKGAADAIYARKMAGDASGSAGNFVNEEPSNPASTLFAMTNAANGFGTGAMNTANGNAFGIFQGGMKVSTHVLSSGTTITTRAIAYQITGGGPYTFSLTPALSDGEMFFVYNNSGASVTVGSTPINNNSGILFIVLGGVARPF